MSKVDKVLVGVILAVAVAALVYTVLLLFGAISF